MANLFVATLRLRSGDSGKPMVNYVTVPSSFCGVVLLFREVLILRDELYRLVCSVVFCPITLSMWLFCSYERFRIMNGW